MKSARGELSVKNSEKRELERSWLLQLRVVRWIVRGETRAKMIVE